METNTMTAAEFLATLPAAYDLTNGRSELIDSILPAIRRDWKLAIAAGLVPSGVAISARTNHYASFIVQITAWPGQPLSSAYVTHLMGGMTDAEWGACESKICASAGRRDAEFAAELCDEVNNAVALLEAIANRHNYDHSRIEEDYFSVGYYLTVNARPIRQIAEQGVRAESNPGFRALQAAAIAAIAKIGPKCAKSILGRSKIDTADEWTLHRLVKLGAMATGELVYDKRRSRWVNPAPMSATVGA